MQHYLPRLSDKEANTQKRRIEKLQKKWRVAGFGWWNITTQYLNDIKESDAPDDFCIHMTMRTDWCRMNALLSVNLSGIADLSDEQLEKTYLHELMHCVVAELASCIPKDTKEQAMDAEAHEERVVQQLANHMYWAHRHVK